MNESTVCVYSTSIHPTYYVFYKHHGDKATDKLMLSQNVNGWLTAT